MRRMKNQKGITLIALIITIIILLILAVVTIMSVNGDGIISKAKQAKAEYQNAQAEEQNILDRYLAEMEGLGGNNTTGSSISTYEDGVPIPVGFKYVEGTKDTGLVVENEADGSQFVWVPVTEPISEYGIGTEDYREPDVITKEPASIDGYGVQDGADKDTTNLNIINNILGTSYSNSDEFLSVLQEDFNLMAESVNKNGGFYVGRYETSLNEENGKKAQSISGVLSVTAEESSANRWYGLYAYQKAYSTESVQGSMIWGSQYDRMMTWMQNTGTDVDSSISGYNQSRVTGSEDYPDDVINNVYDLYGNSYEWTLEASSIRNRVGRGGVYFTDIAPSVRGYFYLTTTGSSLGSRLALYIK